VFLLSSLENQFYRFKLIKQFKWRWTASPLETDGQFLRRCELLLLYLQRCQGREKGISTSKKGMEERKAFGRT